MGCILHWQQICYLSRCSRIGHEQVALLGSAWEHVIESGGMRALEGRPAFGKRTSYVGTLGSQCVPISEAETFSSFSEHFTHRASLLSGFQRRKIDLVLPAPALTIAVFEVFSIFYGKTRLVVCTTTPSHSSG